MFPGMLPEKSLYKMLFPRRQRAGKERAGAATVGKAFYRDPCRARLREKEPVFFCPHHLYKPRFI